MPKKRNRIKKKRNQEQRKITHKTSRNQEQRKITHKTSSLKQQLLNKE
jgi:hypothetical protein